MSPRSPFDRLILPVACVIVWAAHAAVFLAWLPTENGTLGHDYAYFFPALLNGYFWFLENGLAVPWFTPALCGGLPLYPNPESLYYSVPQLLTLMSDPLRAVQASFLVFSGVGVAGAALLLRRVFGVSRSAALLGATVFLFNGYFAHRMLVGHLGFHSVMLVPLLAYAVLRPLPAAGSSRWWRVSGDVALAALATAYMIQSGNHDLVPTVLATGGVMLIAFVRGAEVIASIARAVAGFAYGLLLCASKLAAGFAFLGTFPRSGYPVPGAESLVGSFRMVLEALFWGPPEFLAQRFLVNTSFTLERHEFEYGLTLVPAVLMAVGATRWLILRARRGEAFLRLSPTQLIAAFGLFLLLCIPIVMNLASPTLAAVIKEIPVLKNSSSFIRWIGVYVPIVVVLAALALDSLGAGLTRRVIAVVGVAAVVGINVGTPRAHYTEQVYEPAQLVSAMERVREVGVPTPITKLAEVETLNRNDFMAAGISPLACYEAIFGYRMEWFPKHDLRPGPVGMRHGGGLNLLDPTCFVFPEANACRPGARFRASESARAERFVRYQQFDFERPPLQSAADAVNLAALAGIAIFGVAWGVRAVSGAATRRADGPRHEAGEESQ